MLGGGTRIVNNPHPAICKVGEGTYRIVRERAQNKQSKELGTRNHLKDDRSSTPQQSTASKLHTQKENSTSSKAETSEEQKKMMSKTGKCNNFRSFA